MPWSINGRIEYRDPNDPPPSSEPSNLQTLTSSGGQYNVSPEKLKTDQKQKVKNQDNPKYQLEQALSGAVEAYFAVLMQDGSGHDAGMAAKAQLAGGLASTINPLVSNAVGGGLLGGLLGSLGGGLVGWGLSKAFRLDRQGFDYDTPNPGALYNSAAMQKQYTLPSSKYFFPSGRSNTSSFEQQNTFNITGGPKTGERVVRALNDFDLLMQDNRGRA